MSPNQKQALSGLIVGIAVGALGAIEQALANPPFTLRSLGVAAAAGAVAGIVHWLPALGTKEKVEAKVAERVAEVVTKEPT